MGTRSSHPAFSRTEHRPWPLPRGPWVMRQSWFDLLFAHWPVPASRLRGLVPAELEIDEYQGSSWVGIVPFVMRGVMLRGLPDLPYVSAFPELNVRLYVVRDGKPGVWFLSLDADNALAVWTARALFHLPYHRARIAVGESAGGVAYRSERRSGGAVFAARYRPVSDVYEAAPGSLEHWLTERYCLYARAPSGALLRTDVHHAPWPLQRAEAVIEQDTLLSPAGLAVDGPPAHLHFARALHVVVWRPELVVPAARP